MAGESHLDSSLLKIVKGAGIGFTGSIIGMFLGYLTRLVIARWLGAEDYGLINLGFAAMSIATTLAMVGLPSGIKRYISYYKGQGDSSRIKGTILSGLMISFPLSIILTFLVFFNVEWISAHVFNEPDLTTILTIFALAIPFWVAGQNFTLATIGFQDLRYRVYVNDVFQNVFKLLAIIIFLSLGYGVLGAAVGWVLAIMCMPFLSFYFLESRVFSILKTKVKAVYTSRELFLFSFPLIFAGIAGMVTSWTDTLMLGYFATTEDVGVYNAAFPTARLLSVFLGSFGAIFMPVISELYSRNAMDDLRNTYSAVTKWIFALIVPVFLLMVLFSDWILDIMFGEEFVRGATALSILALGYLVVCIVGPTGQVLQAYGKTRVLMGLSFFGAGINVVLNYILIPVYGVNGAAVATGASLAAMNVFHLVVVYRIARLQPFRRTYLKPFTASILAVAIVYVVTRYVVGVSLYTLVGMFIVFIVLYFFLLLAMKSFEREDLMIMRAIDKKLNVNTQWIRKIIMKFL